MLCFEAIQKLRETTTIVRKRGVALVFGLGEKRALSGALARCRRSTLDLRTKFSVTTRMGCQADPRSQREEILPIQVRPLRDTKRLNRTLDRTANTRNRL